MHGICCPIDVAIQCSLAKVVFDFGWSLQCIAGYIVGAEVKENTEMGKGIFIQYAHFFDSSYVLATSLWMRLFTYTSFRLRKNTIECFFYQWFEFVGQCHGRCVVNLTT